MFYLTDLLVVGFTYLFMTTFENAIHKASHHKSSGRLYRWHKLHHKDYPVTNLESEIYIDSASRFDNMFIRYIIGGLGVFYIASTHRIFIIIYRHSNIY